MNEDFIQKADLSYRVAEQKAEHYFQLLCKQVNENNVFPALLEDIKQWKHNHLYSFSFLSYVLQRKQKSPTAYHRYIDWLNYRGKLDHYLDRSISYIFMRDLGHSLDSPHTQTRINRMVKSLKNYLTDSQETEAFSMASIYKIGQKHGVESTIIWLFEKLRLIDSYIPKELDAENAKRKIIKIVGGVVLAQLEEHAGDLHKSKQQNQLKKAIKLGYCYGLTYPFIDDLLDAKILTKEEEYKYVSFIRQTLLTGTVPELQKWSGPFKNLMIFIQSELKEAFEYIRKNQRKEAVSHFLEQSFVFFHSQEIDRLKVLTDEHYTNEALYLPVILKSASSRMIVRSVIDADIDEEIDKRTFYYGIYNQLADDLADMFDDLKDGAVTPYTYYLTHHQNRTDLVNPFELYWTVIHHLIHETYEENGKAREIILNRAINGLKRLKTKFGVKKFNEVMQLFTIRNKKFNKWLDKMVAKATDVDFFDKLLRDEMLANFKRERIEQEAFFQTVKTVQEQINTYLPIEKTKDDLLVNETIVDAANYSLASGGKRLRPIITVMTGVHIYGLNFSSLIPLLNSLEYMHTASLIFDDLPSQDNASLRRGHPTLHKKYNVSMAELTALFLTQKAVKEQASLHTFESKTVLQLIKYSSHITAEMCKGQAMDLAAKGDVLTLETLNRMCFYKTGLGIEAALVMPAMLASAKETEIVALKKFAYHAGILFQIKDDLLDVVGDAKKLGKPLGKDAENNRSTFVSILGSDGAKKAMWEHYCLAIEALQDVPRQTSFLKHLLHYFMNRQY